MRRIVVKYYSRLNLGDDLFIVLLAKNFPDISFRLIGNPLYISKIKSRPKNLKPQYITSLLLTALAFLSCRFHRIKTFYMKCEEAVDSHVDLLIQISGSIFMETPQDKYTDYLDPTEKITFESAIEHRKKKLSNLSFNRKSKIIIGANIGPIYTEAYLQYVRKCLSSYSLVCLRDLYSYSLCSDMNNVVYAPDVIFNLEGLNHSVKKDDKQHIVFSVICADDKLELRGRAEKYYQLLADTISVLSSEYIIDLVSFCDKEGDPKGIKELKSRFGDNKDNVNVYNYDGDITKILTVFKQADYIIASRFHAMIIGMLYGKPVFPICYGAKMIYYLQDVNFTGKACDFKSLESMTVDDVLFNFKHNIICECEQHKSFAHLQFEGIKMYLFDQDQR